MMIFYPDNAFVPESLHTDNFMLLPLTPDHVELDYAALMNSKEMLRLWSGSPWPRDDFTLAENLEDLKWHWDEHQKRIAFTFTVLNLAEDTCLGCVYIKPMTEISADNSEWETVTEAANVTASTGSTAVSTHSALIRFWTVQETPIPKLDKTLLFVLRQWFAADWAFSEIYWHTPVNNPQQIDMFQAHGLRNLGRIQMPNRGGEHFLFQ
jgi:RimJ/RimL family protein N-acetyltransferase